MIWAIGLHFILNYHCRPLPDTNWLQLQDRDQRPYCCHEGSKVFMTNAQTVAAL